MKEGINMEVRYRLETDYYTKEYDDRMLMISSPIYTLEEGMQKYSEEIKEFCIDDPTKPARVHLWKYNYVNDEFAPITIMKNY